MGYLATIGNLKEADKLYDLKVPVIVSLKIQEFEHFVDCVQNDREHRETGQDGRTVMEAILAAYASAGQGRRIDLPFATAAARPMDLWACNT